MSASYCMSTKSKKKWPCSFEHTYKARFLRLSFELACSDLHHNECEQTQVLSCCCGSRLSGKLPLSRMMPVAILGYLWKSIVDWEEGKCGHTETPIFTWKKVTYQEIRSPTTTSRYPQMALPFSCRWGLLKTYLLLHLSAPLRTWHIIRMVLKCTKFTNSSFL